MAPIARKRSPMPQSCHSKSPEHLDIAQSAAEPSLTRWAAIDSANNHQYDLLPTKTWHKLSAARKQFAARLAAVIGVLAPPGLAPVRHLSRSQSETYLSHLPRWVLASAVADDESVSRRLAGASAKLGLTDDGAIRAVRCLLLLAREDEEYASL